MRLRSDNCQQSKPDFARLVSSFPSLSGAPRTPEELLEWLEEEPSGETAYHAAAFCLETAGQKVQFEMFDAVDAFDERHLAALFRALGTSTA